MSITSQAGLRGASGILTIDLGAVCRNYQKLASIVFSSKVGAVVKANGYGLGAKEVSMALCQQGCRHFFVDHFMEAVSLRAELPRDALIFILNSLQPGNEVSCADSGTIPVINSLDQFR